MKKSIIFKLALVAFALVFSVNASAGIIDGLLKPLLEQFNVTETTVQWSNVPVYSAQKVVETDADGKEVLNEDGTPSYRVFLIDQNGNKRSKEAVDAQIKQVNNAVLRITAKVGAPLLLGILTGKKDVAIIGSLTGGLLSIGDIVSAYKLKMSLGKQKKLLKTYSQAFNDEGKPIAAKVDSKTLSDLGLTDANTISQTTADLLKDLGGSDYTTHSVAALDDVDFSKLD